MTPKNNLKKFRTSKKGLTQAKLACLCGWPGAGSRIGNYENSRIDLYLNIAREIVWALNEAGVTCTLDEVFPAPLRESK